jgi:MFS transporter, OFA family, oxalate/formate antiporter
VRAFCRKGKFVKRFMILLSALVMQMCLGATYSWSVFVRPLRDLVGLSQGAAQLPFSVFYFAFPATMILSGMFLRRLGPRGCAMIGGVLFGTGWLVASLGTYHFLFTVLGIGLLAGIGVGLAYVVPIAVCVQWFPRQKGLVTGIAVAGFGGGAALVGQIAGTLMFKSDFSPFATFWIFGGSFLVLVPIAGFAMEFVEEFKEGKIPQIDLSAIIGRQEFRTLFLAMIAGLAAGFAVNANLKDLSPVEEQGVGIVAVSLFALANAGGRLIWGAIFDKLQSATAVAANLLLQGVVTLCGIWLLRSQEGFLAFALLTGFNYGGVLVVYASSVARIWGREHVGQVYGVLFAANIVAALAPILAGFSLGLTGTFSTALGTVAVLLTVAAVFVWTAATGLNVEQRTG